MKLEINKISNQISFEIYLKSVESFNVTNPFYKIWFSNIHENTQDELSYFSLRDEKGTLLILMPIILRRIPHFEKHQNYFDVSSPYGYSGPLFNEAMSRGYLILFWELVDAWYKDNHVVSEFIRFSLNNNYHFYSGKLVPTLTNVNGCVVDEVAQWQNFKQKVRNNYRKSAKEGLKVKFLHKGLTKADIKQFYDIYITTMSRIGADKEYRYSLEYFESIIELSGDDFMIALVFKGDVAISTELVLISGTSLFSFLGGTLSEYFKLRPNDFLKIEVLNWARQHGYTQYVLGGGRTDGDSLYQYKKSFFPNDKDLIFYTGRKIINTKIYKKLDNLLNSSVISECVNPDEKQNKQQIGFFPVYRKNAFSN
ncbi:GNAT family N-acetyltransferase [Mariniflexile sp. AS56]|uniref:GNAT family N-acetyltransferase n=1 Tax=Mariniflexile sp. AS56 TaxID=3063957 RepID=UPI0026F02AEB|nr:GNAT family N-acetyltransferase [Mariniflexile sp. AS56]MDO7171351.1 GNAT family N-acetyltransferase [Mariniflexile sp. AS56]